ncbi:MAG: hypothetical protein J0I79_23580 [Mesorhizobium sp.]|uniref:hypothetical protein n=1 Tax=Mesorhizobium sp. TaxID=1871066 RepID=UPI001AD3BABE|nr:hypothetical protein [Mesorhizobium sp.]MBN9220938.1 hypothetical protein [Mesorhizobium sp.]
MEQLIYGLVAAWISTTAWLAYKHHRQFPPIAIILIAASLLGGVSLLSYNMGLQTGAFASALADIKAAQVPINVDTRAVVDELVGNRTIIAFGLLAYAAFVTVLMGLPQILDLAATGVKDTKE